MQSSCCTPFYKMIVFHTDLDNTMIYSYKHDIGDDKRGVELYQGRTISFVTEYTYELLNKVKEKVLIVPTTTRTLEQYVRIDLGVGGFEYALACNGGVLLVNGQEDEEWYQESLALVQKSREAVLEGIKLLEKDENVNFEIRYIKDLFVFTKSKEPQVTVQYLKDRLNTSVVDVFYNGVKVYIVPVDLNKGEAVRRFRKRVSSKLVIGAGDSDFDIPMLEEVDEAIAPEGLPVERKGGLTVYPETELFSEKVLETVLAICKQKS